MTWVKICGIRTIEEARSVALTGVAAVGLNLAKRSKRYVDPLVARGISASLMEEFPALARVGIIADLPGGVRDYLDIARRAHLTHLQLHGAESEEVVEELCDRGWPVIRAVRVSPGESAERVSERIESLLDATESRCRVLVDAHIPGTGFGGTGQRIDTQVLRELLQEFPLIVAGGLNPRNVSEIMKLAPGSDGVEPGIFGVDVASGVEGRNGRKDITLVKRFVAACRT